MHDYHSLFHYLVFSIDILFFLFLYKALKSFIPLIIADEAYMHLSVPSSIV